MQNPSILVEDVSQDIVGSEVWQILDVDHPPIKLVFVA